MGPRLESWAKSRQALASALFLVLLCALGFLLRTTNLATVFVGDAVVFPENDPYYHMRRVFLILRDYPHVPYVDPWMDYPRGAPIVFAPLFDLGIATLARLAGFGPADRLSVETLAAFVPPLLGAVTCVAVFWFAAQATSRRAAPLAALIATLVPAHIWYSRLGFVDHHVAVTLLAVTTYALALRALYVGRTESSSRPDGWSRPLAVLAAVAIAAGMLLWNGYLLMVAILDAYLAILFVSSEAARRRAIASFTCAAHLGAAALVLPVAIDVVRATGGVTSTITLSYLHVAYLAGFGALAGIAVWTSARAWPLRRTLTLLASVVSGFAIALIVERSALEEILHWALRSDPFMASVQESVSILFESDGRLDLAGPQIWMSRFFFVVPLLLVLLARRVLRSNPRDEGRLFVLIWAGALFLFTLRQRRFGETLAPALAVLVADSVLALVDAMRRSATGRRLAPNLQSALAAATVGVLLLIAFAPYYSGFVAAPERLTALLHASLGPVSARADDSSRAQQEQSSDVRLHRALTRFADLVRDTSGPPGAGAGGYGVMNPWPLGHKLLYIAEVPVTATPFGTHVGGRSFDDSIDFFLATDERRALEMLAERRSRYVVVEDDLGTIGAAIVGRGENPRTYYGKAATPDGGVAYAFNAPLIRTLYLRLTRLAGSQATLTLPDGSTEVVPALDHLRLVLDAPSDEESAGFPMAFEVVPGATLIVSAEPRQEVSLRYEHESGAGRHRVYQKTAVTDAAGEARFVLPYSSERPDLGQTSAWVIEGAGAERTLRVGEKAVREGRELRLALGRVD